MKISKQIMCLIAGVTLSFTAVAKTESVGSGTRGGGHSIDVDSTPFLMDLVTKAVCEWKKGDELIAELPSIQKTLEKLNRLDWYFSADLKDAISNMNFCLTGPLYTVPAYEFNSVTTHPAGERTRQAGYRLYENAYIDHDIFESMNEDNKGMLIIHETMHSYLAMNTVDRSLKLRSMVKTLDKVRKGEIVTRGKLHYDMQMNDIMFPLNVDQLDGKKEAVMFLKGSMDYKKKALLRTIKLEELINLTPSQVLALSEWDASLFESTVLRNTILKDALIATMQTLSPNELETFLNEKELKKLSLVKTALNDFYAFSKDQQLAILSSGQFNKMLNSGFDEILNERLLTTDFLVVASPEFQEIVTGKGLEATPVVRLTKALEFPQRLNWLIETMIILQENKSLNVLTSNEKFYRALGLKNQKEQLQNSETRIEREKSVALESLDNLSKALVDLLLNKLRNRVDAETYSEMVKNINLNNF